MMDSRKFRRKRKPMSPEAPVEEDLSPIAPLDTREERLARRAAEAEAQQKAEAETRAEQQRQIEEEQRREAEQLRLAEEEARAQAEADQRRRAEEEARAEAEAEQRRHAEEQARAQAEAEQRRQAEEQARAKAEAEQRRRAEEQARAEADADEEARAAAEAQRIAEVAAIAAAAEEKRRARIIAARIEAQQAPKGTRAARAAQVSDGPMLLNDPQLTAPGNPPQDDMRDEPPGPPSLAQHGQGAWGDIPFMELDLGHLNSQRIITADRLDPAHTTFDVLRTRLLHALNERGWTRVAITSPGKGCGKTFSTANLAISLSRQESLRTMVMDFDMRRPSLHQVMGVQSPGSLGAVLRGTLDPEDHLLRLGQNSFDAGHNIAFALNTVVEPYASELLQDPRAARALNQMQEAFQPDIMLFDLPPALFYDDVIAFKPQFDGVLLVIGGGLTTEREIKDVERRLGPDTPLLGMVLNKAEGADVERYAY